MRFLRGALLVLAGAWIALALSYHIPRASGRILTRIPPETPVDWHPKLRTWKNGVLMKYADVQSLSHPSDRLRLSPNADLVRLTVAHYDEFDDSFDSEVEIGDFSIDELKTALASLDRPTAPIHTPGGKPQAYLNRPTGSTRSKWFR